MKDNEVHRPLDSVQEVAVFAWSLLELLFTRILPLVGFLVAHLVFQAGHLVSEVLTPSSHSPSAYRRRHRRTFGLSEDQQRRPWPTYSAADLASPRYTSATAAPWDYSSLSGFEPSAAPRYASADYAEPLQETQPFAEMETEPDDFSRQVHPSRAPQEAAAVSGYQIKELTEPSAMQMTVAARLLEEQAQPSSLQTAIASPVSRTKDPAEPRTADAMILETLPTAAKESDGEQRHSSMPASEAAAGQVVQAAPTSDQKVIKDGLKNGGDKATGQPSDPRKDEANQTSDSSALLNNDDSVAERCNPSTEGRVGKLDKPDEKVEPVSPEHEFPESIGLLIEATKRPQFSRRRSLSHSKHPFAKVLPPSLSQIKRTIMQRSRRGSPSVKSLNLF